MNAIMLTRERNEDRALPALARLLTVVTENPGTGQARRVERFLLGLYCGSDFPFDLTDLRALDWNIKEDCLRVLAMDVDGPRVEIHKRLPRAAIIAEWAAEAWPDK